MRNKRILAILLVVGLLALMTSGVYAVSRAQAATPSIVGTWRTVIPKMEGNPRPTFESLLTFTDDGNMVEVNSMNPAVTPGAHGVWIGSSNNYLVTFETYTFDDQGKNTGHVIAHLSIKMDSPDHFVTTYTADVVDLNGKVTKNVVHGTADSTRMEVELP